MMLNPDETCRAHDALQGIIDSVDSGDTEATKAQRSVIAGAVVALAELRSGDTSSQAGN